MKDFLGHHIRVGDVIVFPARTESSLCLRRALVEKLTYEPNYNDEIVPTVYIKTPTGHTKKLSNLDKICVVKESRRG